MKIVSKNGRKSDFSRCSKIGFGDFLSSFFAFPLIFFHFYDLYDLNVFTDTFFDVRKVFPIPSTCVKNDFHDSVAA